MGNRKEGESEVFSFSATNDNLIKILHAWQDDKIFSAMVNKYLKKALGL